MTTRSSDHNANRAIPKSMVRHAETGGSTVTAKTTVTAFSNDVEGQCPVCKTQMSLAIANGVNVYVCMDHRVTMPIKNES